jgi:hypothetical protein
MITVATLSELHEAQLLRSRLEADGIPALIPDEMTVQMNWQLCQAIGGLRIQVADQHEEKAKEIASEFILNLNTPTPKSCPLCHSVDCAPEESRRSWGIVGGIAFIFMIFGLPIPWKPKQRCRSCGHLF